MYKIVRLFNSGKSAVVETDMTLGEAQAWVADPEHASTTCVRSSNIRRTAVLGAWHDEYQSM
jgi:hypothetical protein